ncbi:hypothetical protein B0H65DRAFT_592478 [Neurospora tetraspora]|uniref:Trichothecene 3-O-acetyltransferase n=1 Tax=Neurospora tetraspora TaxID=94610 RepID=A0AAE0J984_9PEZI|nr:hypothetical protein B0H65DRAFT_592478 [Neurospora tetraspora]
MTNTNTNNHEQKPKTPTMTSNQVLDQAVNKAMDESFNESTTQPTTQPTTPSPVITTSPLGLWNNVAPRVYTPRPLCFPFSPSARLDPLSSASTILRFLRIQLLRLVKVRPAFAGKLQLGINLCESDRRNLTSEVYNDWHVYLQTCEGYEIPLTAHFPDHEEVKGVYAGIEERFEPRGVKGWPSEFGEYDELKRAGFPVEPFVNPLLTDLSTLEEGGEALPAVQVRILFLKGGFILNVLGHHTMFDGGAFTQSLNILAEHTRSLSPTWEAVPESHDLALSLPTIEKPYEELLAECPEYKEWEDHAPDGPTHPVCPRLREDDSLTGSSKIFVFTFAKLVQLQKEIAAHGVKAGIYECLSGLLWALTYFSRVTASSKSTDPSSFERFLHDHFASEQPVFSTPTDWIARVAALKSTDPEVVAFKEQIAKDTKEYLGNKITWISTRLPSASLLIDAAEKQDLAALAKIVAAINKSSTDMAENMEEYITTRTSLFAALSNPSDDRVDVDIRHIGLALRPPPAIRMANEQLEKLWRGHRMEVSPSSLFVVSVLCSRAHGPSQRLLFFCLCLLLPPQRLQCD